MDYQLVLLRGRSAATAVKLQDTVTTAGRADDCHLRIRSSQVSRRHCELFEKHGLLLVKDLGSANGTFVNGKKIEGQRVMEAGDELSIGPITFRVEKIGQPAPARPAAPEKAPSDTAITAGAAVAEAVPDDDFEIDFDESPSGFGGDDLGFEIELDDALSSPAPAAAAADAEFEIDPDDSPAPAAPAKKPAAAKAKEPEPAPPPAEETGLADDAIADFLSGIKLDD